jgi:hypothetical protein
MIGEYTSVTDRAVMPNAATPAARHTKPSRAIHGNGVSRRTTIGGCGTASGSSDRRRRNA